MKKLYELKENLIDELESYSDKGMNASNLQTIDTLAHAAKNVCKIIESAEEMEYSGTNYSGRDYSNRRMMNDRSYAQRRDSRGRYSGNYSRTDDMVAELHELMDRAPENAKGEFKRFIERVEMM